MAITRLEARARSRREISRWPFLGDGAGEVITVDRIASRSAQVRAEEQAERDLSMAKVAAAWGIDIGQCALKALRCTPYGDNSEMAVAEAFDYIEYPKILTQPEADPVKMVQEALRLFLSRNDIQGTQIAVSVSGQSGLARFIKLPPVETKKIPDIVRYEANQQIPFDLDDVIWDYQRMFVGSEEEGFALDAEVGLFAMKRDQVYQEIEPYQEAGIDIDIVQLTPLAIYNYVVFDQIDHSMWEAEYDPADPPESIVVLSIGTEATDLVITNGYRVWQRNVPLGGSHFTKALVKELQLTYAKAEHLKRNATRAEDPKTIYQAMRPIFKDLLTEIQRSIGYFQSLDRAAKISRVVALGNSMKLPGLRRYLNKNLGYQVGQLTEIKSLANSTVTQSPAFKDNILAFGVPYGLALQGISKAYFSTNLVPTKIIWDRTINRKKPWAIAATVLLGIGCLINFLILWWSWSQVRIDDGDDWQVAKRRAVAAVKQADDLQNRHNEAVKLYDSIKNTSENRLAMFSRRKDYLNLCLAIYQCLPDERNRLSESSFVAKDQGAQNTDKEEQDPELDSQETQDPMGDNGLKEPEKQRVRTDEMKLWITDMKVRKVPDLGRWFTPDNKEKFKDNNTPLQIANLQTAEPQEDAAAALFGDKHASTKKDMRKTALPAPKVTRPLSGPPRGPGFIVELTGYHFHNSRNHGTGKQFIQRTLIHNLQEREITIPNSGDGGPLEVPVNKLGISHPLVFKTLDRRKVLSPFESDQGQELTQYRFVIQFAWKPESLEQL